MPTSVRRTELRVRPWVVFAGCVLIVVMLKWAQAVLVPVALALLLTFLLNPPVTFLQRWIGRPVAVAVVVLLTLIGVGLLAWVLGDQVVSLAAQLPEYRDNIREKVADIRGASENHSLQQVQHAVDEIKHEIDSGKPHPAAAAPEARVVVAAPATDAWTGLPSWTSSLMGAAGSAALVTVLVSFMLLEYRDLRARLIAVIGHGYLASTTKAIDEAASRLSRYLLMQSLVNVTYGTIIAIGLSVIGVPYAVVWGAFGTVMRFIPYVGPWIAAGAPTLLSLAVFPGWHQPLWTIGLFVSVELFTNVVLETFLYAGAAGVSQVALLVGVAFWTWLWGPIGLVMATPLTVCLVVLGKHVPGLWFVSMMMSDVTPLSEDAEFYQRLLAGDQGEALDLLEAHLDRDPGDGVFDVLLLPPLNYAERDRRAQRISEDDERSVALATRDMLVDAATYRMRHPDATPTVEGRLRVLGYPIDSISDEVALGMLAELVRALPVELDVASGHMLVAEMVTAVREKQYVAVCLADLPPSTPSKSRYIVKRLRQSYPDLRIFVGRWAPPSLATDDRAVLIEAGATEVSTSLITTRDRLRELTGERGTSPEAQAVAS